MKRRTSPAKKKGRRLDGWNLVGLVLGVIGVVGTFFTIIGYRAYIRDKKTIPTSGVIESPKLASKRILAIGSARLIVDCADGVLMKEGSEPLITLNKHNDKLYVSATIRDASGEIVAKLDDNEWQLNKDHYYDRNFTRKAIEVVDHSGNVVLQVVDFGDIIHFAGIFHRKDGSYFTLIPLGELGAVIDPGKYADFVFLRSAAYANSYPEIPESIRRNPIVPPIFEYPSNEHLGSCPGLDALRKVVGKADDGLPFTGYRFQSALDIERRHLEDAGQPSTRR